MPDFGGGIRSSASCSPRAGSARSRRSCPGTMNGHSPQRALLVSSRRSALRALASGPWQMKTVLRQDRQDVAAEATAVALPASTSTGRLATMNAPSGMGRRKARADRMNSSGGGEGRRGRKPLRLGGSELYYDLIPHPKTTRETVMKEQRHCPPPSIPPLSLLPAASSWATSSLERMPPSGTTRSSAATRNRSGSAKDEPPGFHHGSR